MDEVLAVCYTERSERDVCVKQGCICRYMTSWFEESDNSSDVLRFDLEAVLEAKGIR